MTDTPEFARWVARARATSFETVVERRALKVKQQGSELVGACPHCGGEDRFSIDPTKQLFNCRNCGAGKKKKSSIDLARFLLGCEFIPACEFLAEESAPKLKSNAKDHTAVAPKKVVVNRFHYDDEKSVLLFQVERVEYKNADGTLVLGVVGTLKKT